MSVSSAGDSSSCESRVPEVLCIGQAVVDCITRNVQENADGSGKKVADRITLNVGGDAVNESIALAGMGRRAGLLCCVGDDHAGTIILEQARRHGVSTDCVTVRADLATPVANIFVQADGSRSSVSSRASLMPGYEPDLQSSLDFYGTVLTAGGPEGRPAGEGRDTQTGAEHPGSLLPPGIRVISFASLFRAPLDNPAVIRRLIRQAHESGAIVCADTKLPTFRRTELSEISDVLPMIDYFFPNEEEAAYYTDLDDPREAVMELLSMGIRGVVIKRGAKGICAGLGRENPAAGCREKFCSTCLAGSCSIRDNEKIRSGEFFAFPAVPVDAVDTTGAGDHFVAGFITALLKNMDFRGCCGMGLEAAARCIGHTGGTE